MRIASRRTIAILGLGLAITALAAAYDAHSSESKLASPLTRATAAAADHFVVHEWGTFTNFAGADGVQLEFRPFVDHELPGFVFNRQRQAYSPFIKAQWRAPVRMETPVTYFYTDRPRDVSVKVQFPQGLLTEFYPPVQSMGPAYDFNRPAPLKDSFLDWGRVHLIPQALFSQAQLPGPDGKPRPAALPAVTGDDHYGFARQTDSAIVQTADQYSIPHFEKFLFYRGLGNFQLPLTLESLSGGRFSLTNFGPDPIRSLFLVQIDGGRARFLEAAPLSAGGALYLELPTADSSIDELATRLERALIATGLYDKEAQAMVNTWRSSWFGEDGTRLLYLVPERLTNSLLPLTVTPPPDEQVRVLVGRIEIMTPEREQQLKSAIEGAGTCLDIDCDPIHSELQSLGRFAEPALERLARDTSDESLRMQVEHVLTDVRLMRDRAGSTSISSTTAD